MHHRILALAVVVMLPLFVAADTPERAAAVGALEPLQELVGVWKGVGTVARGSNKGGWIEQADWQWKFAGDKASIEFAAPAGKHFVSGTITSTDKAKFHLAAKTADGTIVGYSGKRDADGVLTLDADDAAAAEKNGGPSRVTIRTRAEGARLSVLLEKKTPTGDAYARLAEIGYTRQGSGFGKGSEGPECVVTGGQGTMEITYKGKKYYVCCTGCKDAFEENPDKIIAEYEAKKAKKKAASG
jgi:YHS domain-containing protein